MSTSTRDSRPTDSHSERVAVVTGAGRGIGQALCGALAARGADVVGVDVGAMEQTAELVSGHGSRWLGRQMDVTGPGQVSGPADMIAETFGRVDILVNNAASDDPIAWDDLDLELDRWRTVLTVDLQGPGVTRTAVVVSSLPPGALEAAAQTRAIKRVDEPEDIAGAVLFLTSVDSAFVTGPTILANGGACFG